MDTVHILKDRIPFGSSPLPLPTISKNAFLPFTFPTWPKTLPIIIEYLLGPWSIPVFRKLI